ncbi:MAG: APC family permease [Terriglobia bacterium]|jgi:amino acid transporter|nr:APC family permease [Terriglobia bacterium]
MSASVEATAAAPTQISRTRKLTTLTLLGATFFMVSGGPFGLEELIGNAGYLRSIIIILVVPILWALPTTLMVSELSAAIPLDGGYYVWVTRALGPFWGFQEAWLSLASSVFDMALYPTVFVLYASQVFPALGTPRNGFIAGTILILFCTLLNLSGVRKVGVSAVIMGVALLGPFVVMSGIVFAHPGRWHALSHTTEGTLLTGVLVCMWNYMGWDNASTVAGEVENPQRTYVTAMFAACVLVSVTYLVPVSACWLAGVDPSTWNTGAWADVAMGIGGRWLFLGVVLGGMLFGVGTFNSLHMSYTRVPFAMAEDKWLPKSFTKLNRFGVPWVSVIACAVAWVAALTLGFVKLIELDVAIYGLSLALEFAALIALRIKEPDLSRPFRVPGGMIGVVLITLGPAVLIGLAVFDSLHHHVNYLGFTFNNLALSCGVVLLGILQYWPIARRTKAQS